MNDKSNAVLNAMLIVVGAMMLAAVLTVETIRGGPVLGGSVAAACGGMIMAVGTMRRRQGP